MMSNERKELLDKVRQIAYEVHLYLGTGFLEKVYENALVHRLRLAGFKVEQQKAVEVYDFDGYKIGFYEADILVEDLLVLELKAVKILSDAHKAQLLNYLKAIQKPLGMLINFGSQKFEVRAYAGDSYINM